MNWVIVYLGYKNAPLIIGPGKQMYEGQICLIPSALPSIATHKC